MAYSPDLRSRDWGGGPPAAWGVALRLLLVIGLVSLVSLLITGGRVPFLLWFVLPVFFFSLFGTGWHGGHRRACRRGYPRRDEPTFLSGADERAGLGPAGEPAALGREQQLEAELAGARRQVRELEAQLTWQAQLLETPAPQPGTKPEAQAAER
jgi:hypothetical protein